MGKLCVICEEKDAAFAVKGTSEVYCKECAEETYGDLGLLVTVEEQAKALKQHIDNQVDELDFEQTSTESEDEILE